MSEPRYAPQAPVKMAFDKTYFESGCGRPYSRDEAWLSFFGGIADRIISDIQPRTVLDAGCAIGMMVERLRDRGVEAWGIDISDYAISVAHESVKPYVTVASVTEPLARRYDLVVCQEVLEHMPRADSEKAVANICLSTDDVLFSSSPFDFREATHLNVQPLEYWAGLFARHGFFHDVDFDATFITPWAMRLRKGYRTTVELARDFERRWWRLQNENVELRSELASQRALVADLNHQAGAAIQDHARALDIEKRESILARADRDEAIAARDSVTSDLDTARAENVRLEGLLRGYGDISAQRDRAIIERDAARAENVKLEELIRGYEDVAVERDRIVVAHDNVMSERDAALTENARLARLIKGYESGRMMRLLNALNRKRQRVLAALRGSTSA